MDVVIAIVVGIIGYTIILKITANEELIRKEYNHFKSVIINDRNLKYNIVYRYNHDSGGYYITHFYEDTRKVIYRRFLIGSKIEREIPNYIFTIYEDIESDDFSKEQCKKLIIDKLSHYDNKLTRKDEIKKGNLI
jgi:hypothetical protein